MLKAQIDSNKEIFLEALVLLRHVTRAAEATGICAANHYRWMKADPDYKAAYLAIQDELGEKVHEDLINRALNGVLEETTELVKNGSGEWIEVKKRTTKRMSDAVALKVAAALKPELYGDKIRQEVTGANGAPLMDYDITKLPKEKLEQIRDLLKGTERDETPDTGTD